MVFFFVSPQPNEILQTLKYTHVLIIDEMSMMTSTILCAIEQRLKQVQGNINPFANVLLLSISDLAQLLVICRHLFLRKIYIVKFVTFRWLHVGQRQLIMF